MKNCPLEVRKIMEKLLDYMKERSLFNKHEYGNYDSEKKELVLCFKVVSTKTVVSGLSDGDSVIIKNKDGYISVFTKDGQAVGKFAAPKALNKLEDMEAINIENNGKITFIDSPPNKRASVYVELKIHITELNEGNSGDPSENSCLICFLSGDHTRWVQELYVMKCNIPMKEAKALFELYNRYINEYADVDELSYSELSYAGLDFLADEIIDSRKKLKSEMKEGLDYSKPKMSGGYFSFGKYVLKMAQKEPERYGELEYLIPKKGASEYHFLQDVFFAYEAEREEYYWCDMIRASKSEWEMAVGGGLYHCYEIMELYPIDKPLPFDLSDKYINSIFGFNEFEAFADLSQGC